MKTKPALDGQTGWRAVVDRFERVTPENLFQVAGAVQDAGGCVPRAAVAELARRSGISQARLWGALTAYPGFTVTED